jgi:hypothetical protein
VAVDRNQFWQRVTVIDSDEKLGALLRRELQGHQTYFVEVQYEPIPDHEKDAAQNHLTRLQREIDRRRNRLFLILAIVGVVLTMVFGVLPYLKRAANKSLPASTTPPPTSQTPFLAPLPITPQVTAFPTSPPTSTPPSRKME